MMKWIMILVLAVAVGGSWISYSGKGREMESLKEKITPLKDEGDPEEMVQKMETQLQTLEGEQTFNGILLTFLSAGLVGIVFVVYLLPFFAQRVTHAVFDSAEMVEKDFMRDARSLAAQGDYEGAITAYQRAAAADPLNRLPWVEMVKIQKDYLEEPAAAIQTIRHALESQEWEVNDAAYFLFRLAELYDEVNGDRASAVAIMNQVIAEFPETRHSANASHKLHEWQAGGAAAADVVKDSGPLDAAAITAREEEEYLERMKKGGGPA